MKELHYFKDPGNPHITVALAGISKYDWTSVTPDMDIYAASEVMSRSRFDVLPIVEETGVYSCFKTIKWGNYLPENIELYQIRGQDRLYYLTNIEDAIYAYAQSGAKFFFLDNQTDIVGLTTLGNLNCKHVYLSLYNLIIQLENLLGTFIHWKGITDQKLLSLFENRSDSMNALDAVKRYREDDAEAMDYRFIEYIYLTDLGYICRHFKLTTELGYSSSQFKNILAKINNIRNVVAHPNQSLIKKETSIYPLHEAIQSHYELMERINTIMK